MVLLINDVIKYKINESPNYERILWISSENKYCYTIGLNSNKILIYIKLIADLERELDDNVIEIVEDYKTMRLVTEENIDEKSKERRDYAFKVISYIEEHGGEPYIFERRVRGGLVKEASNKFNISSVVIYKYLRLYWQGGKIKDSLLPNYFNCGGVGVEKVYNKKPGRPTNESYINGNNIGIIINDEIKQIFNCAIVRYYRKSEERSLKKAYELMLKDFFSDCYDNKKIVWDKGKIPSFKQFKYWHDNNKDLEEDLRKRKGNREYELNCRALNSNSTYEAFGPGFRYQIDSTVADVYLVNRIYRESVIGRPIVYLAVDVFSRLITALHVALEGPSWEGAASTIFNCAEDKVEFCKRYDVNICEDDWPSNGIPQVFLGDRGELISPIAESAVSNLKISIENAPSYRGDAKGIVEQNFRTMNLNIKQWSPGAVKREYRKRGERDYRLDAKLDIHQFTQMIIYSIIKRNKSIIADYPLSQEMINDDVPPIPIEIWKWGMKYKTGGLRRISNDILKLNLLRRAKVSISKNGIIFNKVGYIAEIGNVDNWFSNARINGVSSREIVYDRRDTSIIYLIDEKYGEYIPCYVKDEYELYKNKSLEEILDYRFIRKAKNSELTDDINQNTVDMDYAIEKIVKEANRLNKQVSGLGKERIKNIRLNRKIENQIYRKSQALLIDNSHIKEESKTTTLGEQDVFDSDRRTIEMMKKKKERSASIAR